MAKKKKAADVAADVAVLPEVVEEPGAYPCTCFFPEEPVEDSVYASQGLTGYCWCPICSVLIASTDEEGIDGAIQAHVETFHPACLV